MSQFTTENSIGHGAFHNTTFRSLNTLAMHPYYSVKRHCTFVGARFIAPLRR
jgi:hypothetical protein